MAKGTRPLFQRCWRAYVDVNVSVVEVGKVSGGKVEININMPRGGFRNACPIRLSYALNEAGVKIPGPSKGYKVSSGKNGRWYIYRVDDMVRYLRSTWGSPDIEAIGAKKSDFASEKGVIAITGSGWSDASGHVTLWNGVRCQDDCHLAGDPENGSFTPSKAFLWKLS